MWRCEMCHGRTSRPQPLLTPEQQQAAQLLLRQAQMGQTPYSGGFNVTPQGLEELFSTLAAGRLPEEVSGLSEIAKTGAPVSMTEAFQKQRELAQTAATRAFEDALAQAARFGAKYSSPGVAAAAREAANVQAQSELSILQQVAQAEERARQRQLEASQLILNAVNAARSLGVDAARVLTAAKQFEVGMDYEEFKRQYPDVYQLLGMLWGRNVDFYIKQRPSMVGPILGVVGTVLGAIIGGPVGAAIMGGVGSAAGQAASSKGG